MVCPWEALISAFPFILQESSKFCISQRKSWWLWGTQRFLGYQLLWTSWVLPSHSALARFTKTWGWGVKWKQKKGGRDIWALAMFAAHGPSVACTNKYSLNALGQGQRVGVSGGTFWVAWPSAGLSPQHQLIIKYHINCSYLLWAYSRPSLSTISQGKEKDWWGTTLQF